MTKFVMNSLKASEIKNYESFYLDFSNNKILSCFFVFVNY